MSKETESELIQQAVDNGRMDNPELDPPDVAETNQDKEINQ